MWFLFFACSHRPPTSWVEGQLSGADLRDRPLIVAPVVFVDEIPGAPVPALAPPGQVEALLSGDGLPAPTVLDAERDAAFLRNDYVGNIRFGGGFIRTGGVALETRARLIEFNGQDDYREQARDWLTDAVNAAVAKRVDVVVPSGIVAAPLRRTAQRGVHPDDGSDNVNLPRTRIVAEAFGGPVAVGPGSSGLVVVPFLRAYYTHNGGWFLGQEYGSMAGARVEVLVAVYDVGTGAVVWSLGAFSRYVSPVQGQATRAELDQYLLTVEADIERVLARRLLR